MLNFVLRPIYRRVVLLVSLITGAWMMIDGVYNLVTGRYIGGTVGPWSRLVSSVGLHPQHLGLVFVIFGLAWGVALAGFRQGAGWGWWAEVAVSVATLWYLWIGTLLSVVCLLLLLRQRPRRGLLDR